MNFDIKELSESIKNFPNLLVRIFQLILVFVFSIILLVVLLPAVIRLYFNYFPITESEYDALGKFVLYSSVIFIILYYTHYLYKLIKFKKQRLESIALLHRKRHEKMFKELEENGVNQKSKESKESRGDQDANNKNDIHEKESRIVEINSVIIPDAETCKKIILSEIEKNSDTTSPEYEKRKNELFSFIMNEFGWDYRKAYYHIFIKKDVDFVL